MGIDIAELIRGLRASIHRGGPPPVPQIPGWPEPPRPRPSEPYRPLIGIRQPTIEHRQSPDYGRGRSGRRIELIIIHSTASGPNLDGDIRWLCAADGAPVSAHYLVGRDGRCVQLVDDADTAWHAGASSWDGEHAVNSRSLGIELDNRDDGVEVYPEPQLQVLMWLVVRACRAYCLKPSDVVGHADVAPGRKVDPRGFPWEPFRLSLEYHLGQSEVA